MSGSGHGRGVVTDLGPTVLPSSADDDHPHYHGQTQGYGGGVKSPAADPQTLEGQPASTTGSDEARAAEPSDISTREGEQPFIEAPAPSGNGMAPAT